MAMHKTRRSTHARHGEHGWISYSDIITCCLGGVVITMAASAQSKQQNLARVLNQVHVASGADSSSATPPASAEILKIDAAGAVYVADRHIGAIEDEPSALAAKLSADPTLRPHSRWLLVTDEQLPVGKVQRLEMALQKLDLNYVRVVRLSKPTPEKKP